MKQQNDLRIFEGAFKLKDKKTNSDKIFMWIFRILPFIIMLGLGIAIALSYEKITVENILDYSPKTPILVALFIFGLYILKSLSIIFPINVLYLVTGFLFAQPWAMIINIIGASGGLTLLYVIGRFSGAEVVQKYIDKNPKFKEAVKRQKKSDVFLAYILRVAGFLPLDVVSMYMGGIRMNYGKYMLGSLLGLMPWLIATTFIGENIRNPKSIEFILSVVSAILVSAVSLFIYYKNDKKAKKEESLK